jgi:hypothetical protein
VARITFQKRQKEMKRLEKQRAKAERRAQRKLAKPDDQEILNQDDLSLPAETEAEPQPSS